MHSSNPKVPTNAGAMECSIDIFSLIKELIISLRNIQINEMIVNDEIEQSF